MAKGNKRSDRRRQDKSAADSDDEDHSPKEEDDNAVGVGVGVGSVLDFAARREFQRKAAAEKRRVKLKCHVCGKAGHVRRDCPGIADDGRGESKYTKSKGDAGAKILSASKKQQLGSNNSNSNSNKNSSRGRKQSYASNETKLVLPAGFSPLAATATATSAATSAARATSAVSSDNPDSNTADEQEPPLPFLFYDASCDSAAVIDYLRSGRGGPNNRQLSSVLLRRRPMVPILVAVSRGSS